mgnify:FL=1
MRLSAFRKRLLLLSWKGAEMEKQQEPPRKHNLDRWQQWSKETIEANTKQTGGKTDAQKEN